MTYIPNAIFVKIKTHYISSMTKSMIQKHAGSNNNHLPLKHISKVVFLIRKKNPEPDYLIKTTKQ